MRKNNILLQIYLTIAIISGYQIVDGQTQKRDRGETFYHCLNSNTSGHGDWWASLTAVGHIWDNTPIAMDTQSSAGKTKGHWVSNIRAFPEVYTHIGLFDIATVSIDSRLLGNFWNPGRIAGDCKLTWPNNKELRLHGYAIDVRYIYQFIESNPTLGGYIGFMPEGFVYKGHTIECKMIYELDLLARLSKIPVRVLVNTGVRVPVQNKKKNINQFLFDAAAVYSGYGFDFFIAYSLEAFNNFTGPAIIQTDPTKKIAVFFPENPMYAIFGGSVRSDKGLTLSLSVPILLSTNVESKMSVGDLQNLHHMRRDLYPQEVKNNIKDPFDPWFVKWKIVGSIGFPLRFKMTSSEMMRNYLILKNHQYDKKINIDNQLFKNNSSQSIVPDEDDKKRLEEIKKRKEQIK